MTKVKCNLPPNLCGCYPFQGALDITVHNTLGICNVLSCMSEEKGSSDESGDSEIIEHGLAEIPEEQHCPKLGQLVAGTHVILVILCCYLTRLFEGKQELHRTQQQGENKQPHQIESTVQEALVETTTQQGENKQPHQIESTNTEQMLQQPVQEAPIGTTVQPRQQQAKS